MRNVTRVQSFFRPRARPTETNYDFGLILRQRNLKKLYLNFWIDKSSYVEIIETINELI